MGGCALKLARRTGMFGDRRNNSRMVWAIVCTVYAMCCGCVHANRVVINCDFQNPRDCGFTQSPDNDFNWIVGKGHSPSWYSGPLADHTYNNSSGYYIYAPSSYNDTQIGQKTRFSFPAYQLREGHGRLRFYYYMWDGYEPDRLGTLTVYACHGLPLWSRERRQRDMWLGTGVLDIYCTQPFELIFEVLRGGFDSDIAVDDIKFVDLYESPPTTAPAPTTTRERPPTTVRVTTPRPTPRRTEAKSTAASTLGRIVTNSTPNRKRKTDSVTPPITWMAGSPSDPPVWTAFVLAGAVGGGFVLCFMAFFVLFFFCRRRRRSKSRSAGLSYNVDNLTYPSTGMTPCGRCDAYYTALQTTRGVELHLYQELHQPAKQLISDSSSSTTNEAIHSADGGFYECIDEDQFSSVTNDNASDYTDAEAAARAFAANTATLPSKQPLTLNIIEPIPFETGPESPISYVIDSVDLPPKEGDNNNSSSSPSCKTPPPALLLEPKYFTLEPDGDYHWRTDEGAIVVNGEHKTDIELSEDEDVMCLSPDDARLNHAVSPSVSYCEPPVSDDDPLTPTQTDSLAASPSNGYVPPITGPAAVPDRGGRRTEIITEI